MFTLFAIVEMILWIPLCFVIGFVISAISKGQIGKVGGCILSPVVIIILMLLPAPIRWVGIAAIVLYFIGTVFDRHI